MKRLLCALLTVALGLFALPASASVPGYQQYVYQQLVQATDLNGDSDTTRNLVGEDLAFLLGAANAQPVSGTFSPLAISQSTSALTLGIGGSGQAVYTQFRLVDSPPSATLTIPANSTGSTRVDVVGIEYTQIQKTGHSAVVGSSTSTVYNIGEGLSYSYTVGTTTPPTGYVAFALVSVPNGATTASACTVQLLFSSVSTILSNIIGGVVSSVNGSSGAITLLAGSNITITGSGGTYTIAASLSGSTGVSALNSLTGSLTLTSSDGSVTITPSGTSINLQASFPSRVASLNGLSGALSLTSSNLNVTASGSSVDVEPQMVYDLGSNTSTPGTANSSGTYRPSAKVCIGSAETGSSSTLTVTCGSTVIGGTGTLHDPTLASSVVVSIESFSGSTITFGAKYANTNTAVGSGLGIYFTVYAY